MCVSVSNGVGFNTISPPPPHNEFGRRRYGKDVGVSLHCQRIDADHMPNQWCIWWYVGPNQGSLHSHRINDDPMPHKSYFWWYLWPNPWFWCPPILAFNINYIPYSSTYMNVRCRNTVSTPRHPFFSTPFPLHNRVPNISNCINRVSWLFTCYSVRRVYMVTEFYTCLIGFKALIASFTFLVFAELD